jgi:Na+-translocating ferredoxin:NAD+ oxidoreductase RnfC subunit
MVRVGDHVREGDLLAAASESALSVPAHASIDGHVTAVGQSIIITRT